MMPHHLDMVRSQCRVEASFGGGVAVSLATVRISPQEGKHAILAATLVEMLRELASKSGLTGAHLLITDTPNTNSPTTEQKIRGADRTADWIVLLSGYDPEVVQEVVSNQLSGSALIGMGIKGKALMGRYKLALTITPQDIVAATQN
jgi:hypothetical protein